MFGTCESRGLSTGKSLSQPQRHLQTQGAPLEDNRSQDEPEHPQENKSGVTITGDFTTKKLR